MSKNNLVDTLKYLINPLFAGSLLGTILTTGFVSFWVTAVEPNYFYKDNFNIERKTPIIGRKLDNSLEKNNLYFPFFTP